MEATERAAVAADPAPARPRLAVEYVVLFFGLVTVYTIADVPGGPIPPLLVLGSAAVAYLWRRSDVDRRDLWRPEALRPALPAMLALWALAAVAAAAVVALLMPNRLAELPRTAPLLWAAVVVAYPLLSVYPQELIFRAFLFHRYAPLFGTGGAMIVASAAAFGYAHIIFGNVWSVVLTLAGGVLFARRYATTHSLLTASVEHALYGVLAFTVGLGHLFFHGSGG